jgi:hypothetical protein
MRELERTIDELEVDDESINDGKTAKELRRDRGARA